MKLKVSNLDITKFGALQLTSGMIGKTIEIEYSTDWNGLTKTAVFSNGKISRNAVNAEGVVEIPAEVLAEDGLYLSVSIYGYTINSAGIKDYARPTLYAELAAIDKGGDPNNSPGMEVSASAEEQLVQDMTELGGRVDTAEDDISGLKGRVTSAESELTDHEQRIGAIEGKESGWNAKYSKPTGGIPKTDLASDVQTSLDKADSALQQHQSLAAYRTSAAQDVIDGGKVDKVTGKGLSTNDFTDAYKTKIDSAITSLNVKADKTALAEERAERLAEGDAVRGQVSQLSESITEIGNKLDNIETDFSVIKETTESKQCTNNRYWNIETDFAVLTNFSGRYGAVDAIPISENDIITVTGAFGTSAKQRGVVIVDADMRILWKSNSYISFTTDTITVIAPKQSAFLLVTVDRNTSGVADINIKRTHVGSQNKYAFLNLSLLGDSISSYKGTIPTGNKVYYTGTNAGVSSADEMWWNIVCQNLNMNPCIINGWSGSTVTSGVRDAETYLPASDVSRTGNLHTNDKQPDVILFAIGVNDYSYNAPLGDWNGTTALNDDTTSFRSAYAVMIDRVRRNYPNALIMAITPWFNQRGTNLGATYKNSLNLTMSDYIDAMRDICNIMGVPVIDGYNIGFNRYNYYPNYCIDSETTPTHPNANGQRVMGETVTNELKQIGFGYLQELR